MPILGITLNRIEGKRNENKIGAVKVNNNTQILDVKERELFGLNKKGLAVEFDFKTEYTLDGKEIGFISMGGEVLIHDDRQDEILKYWKEHQELKDEWNVSILNVILRRCFIKALQMCEDLQLPPPVGLPFAEKQKWLYGKNCFNWG